MPTRAAGSRPSLWMAAAISAVSPPSTACLSCSCSSSSVDISMDLGELLRVAHFVQQDFERGKVGVPLDQRRHRPEAAERRGVEVPNGLGDAGTVVVDQYIHVFGSVMASNMDFANCLGRQRVEISNRVEPEILRADKNIIHIAEDAAARPPSDL